MIKYLSMGIPSHRLIVLALAAVLAVGPAGCKSSGGILGEADETAEAGELVRAANGQLRQISRLYEKNENKREELKNAVERQDAAAVRTICKEIVDSINSGKSIAEDAIATINEALSKNINEDYREYLELKRDALKKQLQAFTEYHKAARELAERYDPKSNQARDEVVAEFKERSENFQKLMQQGRDLSDEANEKAKKAMQGTNEE